MAKIYTKNTWQDEVVSGNILYDISESDDTPIYEEVKIELNADVLTAGTAVNATRMNNIENGIDGLDTIISVIVTGKNVQALTGSLTLDDDDAAQQYLDPNGSNRDVVLPAENAANHPFIIANTADAAENLVVKNDGGTTISTVAQDEVRLFVSDGTAWRQLTDKEGGGGGGVDLSQIYALVA